MIRPLRGYVLIEPIEEETKTSSGVILPDSAKEKPMKGTVLVVGKGTKPNAAHQSNCVCFDCDPYRDLADQTVYYRKWGGEDIKENGKEYKLVKQEDVIAVYE